MTLLVNAQSRWERSIAVHADSALGATADGDEIIVASQGNYVIEILGHVDVIDDLGSLGSIELDRDEMIKLIAATAIHWVKNVNAEIGEDDDE